MVTILLMRLPGRGIQVGRSFEADRMGTSYGNGFIFTQQPAWDCIAQIKPPCALIAYQHASQPIWFACICDQKTYKRNRDLHPVFTAPPNDVQLTIASCQPKTEKVLRSLDQIVATI